MLKPMLTPDEQAAYNAHKRRVANRDIAWKRNALATLVQQATGLPGRAYNQLEAKLARLMDEAGIDYEWQFRLGRYVYDFRLPGTHAHRSPRQLLARRPQTSTSDKLTPTQRRNLRHDAVKAEFAMLCGYRVRVIWELDLSRNRVSAADPRVVKREHREAGDCRLQITDCRSQIIQFHFALCILIFAF